MIYFLIEKCIERKQSCFRRMRGLAEWIEATFSMDLLAVAIVFKHWNISWNVCTTNSEMNFKIMRKWHVSSGVDGWQSATAKTEMNIACVCVIFHPYALQDRHRFWMNHNKHRIIKTIQNNYWKRGWQTTPLLPLSHTITHSSFWKHLFDDPVETRKTENCNEFFVFQTDWNLLDSNR